MLSMQRPESIGGSRIAPADYGCGTAGWLSGFSAVGRPGSWAGPLPWLPAGGRLAGRSPERGRWLFDWCSARKTKAIITASEAEMAEIMMTSSAADIARDIALPVNIISTVSTRPRASLMPGKGYSSADAYRSPGPPWM